MQPTRRERHIALNARDDMLAIADHWPQLRAALRPTGSQNQGMPKSNNTPAPINLTVSEVIEQIRGWVMFLARVLADETGYRPASLDTTHLLTHIARNHIGHFTEHQDETLRLSFMDDAADMRRLVERTIAPTGARWRKLDIDCAEHATSDMGERIPCPGQYRVWWDPAREIIGDLVCNHDNEHRVTALEWQRSWRKSHMNEQAVRGFLTRLREGA